MVNNVDLLFFIIYLPIGVMVEYGYNRKLCFYNLLEQKVQFGVIVMFL